MRIKVLGSALTILLCAGMGSSGELDQLPSIEPIELVAVLTTSELTYNIILSSDVAKDAGGPDRAEPQIDEREKRVLARCKKLIEEKQYAKAEKILGAQVRKNKGNHDASALRALCLMKMDENDKSLKYLRASLIGNRRNPEAWLILEELAGKLGKKVVRPRLTPKSWVRSPDAKGEIDLSHADADVDGDYPWMYYGVARVYYRHEGPFKKDFPKAKEYRFTFREQLFALGATLAGAEGHEEGVTAELQTLLDERKAGRVIPFAFFAIYPEPIPKKPEDGFKDLLPTLEKYFDDHILVAG